ncbi:MAG: hypothetical protein A3C22_02135 [Candidatus Levybacteria bacterium RIFCSPHIGHO2_02_FULL_37_10]|nr:MAG: hypothetical protein A3C22_02135 [Candidatus Levybacteria bacterium RIFCSPHIGHO2_02_FULL_37_10]
MWSFALVNNKLAEVFFERKRGENIFFGHAYVKESEYATRREKRWIKEDATKVRLVYRKGKYKFKN